VNRIHRVNRVGRIGRAGAPRPLVDLAHAILTVTNNAGVAGVTTAAPHGLTEGSVVITGTSGGLYDGPFFAVATSATTFDLDTAYAGDATGGTWSPA
jgi:hypothetical protein